MNNIFKEIEANISTPTEVEIFSIYKTLLEGSCPNYTVLLDHLLDIDITDQIQLKGALSKAELYRTCFNHFREQDLDKISELLPNVNVNDLDYESLSTYLRHHNVLINNVNIHIESNLNKILLNTIRFDLFTGTDLIIKILKKHESINSIR